jgi:hypothetical protein
LCPYTKHTLTSYRAGDERCNRCKCRKKKKCYHHEVCDSVRLPVLLQALKDELGRYYEKHGKTYAAVSKLRTDPMQLNKESDILHIDYIIPEDNEEKLREYAQFITRECRIRSIPVHGRLEDWRFSLHTTVVLERIISALEKVKKWDDVG